MTSKKQRTENENASKPDCFVLMPVSDPDGYQVGHFQRVYEDIFMPACENAGFRPIRADDVQETNLIHLDILQKLLQSTMAICDLSARNPNVLFELGLRQAFDKPVVLVQEVGTPPIFDIAPLRYVEYRAELQYRGVLEDQQKLTNAIEATANAFRTGQGINSIVKLLSLTHPAALEKFAENDKESALLQIILTEIGSIRSDLNLVKTERLHVSSRPTWTLSRSAIELLVKDMRAVRKELIKLLKNESTEDDNGFDFVDEIKALQGRLIELRSNFPKDGTDEDAEMLALVATQIKKMQNQYRRYRQATTRSPLP